MAKKYTRKRSRKKNLKVLKKRKKITKKMKGGFSGPSIKQLENFEMPWSVQFFELTLIVNKDLNSKHS